MENGRPIYRWFTMVYLLKMVIFHGYVSQNQRVYVWDRSDRFELRAAFVPLGNIIRAASELFDDSGKLPGEALVMPTILLLAHPTF
jgi:hypothetical protein